MSLKGCNYLEKAWNVANAIVPHLQASQDAEGYLNHLQEYHQKQQ